MSQNDRLERDLTAWFVDTAMPRTPDYVDDILERTERVRQRPRWTFVTRWLPGLAAADTLPIPPRLPWRTIVLVAMIAVLAAAAAIFVGSRPRVVPPPFGLAENGLFAYSDEGDVFVLDRNTGLRRALDEGTELDTFPRWSLDGMQVAFLREEPELEGQRLVVADIGGRTVTSIESFRSVDPDSIAWSPDGRTIAIAVQDGSRRAIALVDTIDGSSRLLNVDYHQYEVYWRPPDGRQLLFRSRFEGILLVDVQDERIIPVGADLADPSALRPVGWAPDGRSFLYQRETGAADTHLVNVETGEDTALGVAFGHLSNDGRRVAGLDLERDALCVAFVTAGPCVEVPLPDDFMVAYDYGAGIQWSPDDRWIVLSNAAAQEPWLIDPDGRVAPERLKGMGTATIQRVAP
jgi:hypothetical protein